AVEKFNEEQQTEIANLMDDAPDEGLPSSDRIRENEGKPDETPSDETAKAEQESQPEARDPEVETEAKAEEQPPTEAQSEVEADVPESDEQPESKPASRQFVSGEQYENYEVEIVTEDGAKSVPLNNLITTYHKYPETQRKWAALKPVYELAQKAQVEVNQVLPLLELGIQTYAKQQGIIQGVQPPVDGTFTSGPPATPGGYNGPFKDAETDEYYKEADPEIWQSMHNNFRIANGAAQRMSSLENEIRQIKSAPPEKPPGPTPEEVERVFNDKIKSWAGDHNDYFTAQNIGEVRLTSFKNFIVKNHAGKGLKIADLTPEFLQSEFARFDPKYNLAYMEQLAAKKAKEAQNDSGMFAEGSGVRSVKTVPLDEQQGHMADML
ncbi:MAG: hypothetical protein JRF72_15800, partial [Deltaproteobacteria bacterium]|nr:hypothetical protein [Deltaproteobacteria bacterium]